MIVKKVLLVGSFGVGKTSLVRRFVNNEFSEDYISTIGVRVSTKMVQENKQVLKLLIWDIAGTEENERIPKAYFLGACAAMFVFDLSREETYSNISGYVDDIKELSGLDNFIIIGNKVDLLSLKELEEVKNSIPEEIDFITSAKEDENVEDAFKLLAKLSLK